MHWKNIRSNQTHTLINKNLMLHIHFRHQRDHNSKSITASAVLCQIFRILQFIACHNYNHDLGFCPTPSGVALWGNIIPPTHLSLLQDDAHVDKTEWLPRATCVPWVQEIGQDSTYSHTDWQTAARCHQNTNYKFSLVAVYPQLSRFDLLCARERNWIVSPTWTIYQYQLCINFDFDSANFHHRFQI